MISRKLSNHIKSSCDKLSYLLFFLQEKALEAMEKFQTQKMTNLSEGLFQAIDIAGK